MTSRRFCALTLALAIACLPSMAVAQQRGGSISGRAGDQFKPQYTDYTVQVRNATNGLAVGAKSLDADGKFAFTQLALNQKYLVEIYRTKSTRLVCTEGPFSLVTNQVTERTNVTIECGKAPAMLWLLAAAGGTASAVGLVTASGSR